MGSVPSGPRADLPCSATARQFIDTFETVLAMRHGLPALGILVATSLTPLSAADDAPFAAAQQVLEHRCLSCHNSRDQKGGFALQTRQELSDSGMIAPGDPQGSHLLSVVLPEGANSPAMPKDATPLRASEVAALRTWIESGAEWPEGATLSEPQVDNFDWWSLQPLSRPALPDVADFEAKSWARTPIDQFVLAKLKEQNLTPSPAADRRTLIRRLSFDLVGLPPTPEQIEEFVSDPDPLAYERLVDRLLASPGYGERWGRHWLDVVKYADTCGYDKDKLRPNAWPYRDYVIRSFNEDKPYARFVREQIAGDILYSGTPDGILGLGFVAAGPWDFIGHVEVPESKIDGKVARNLDRDEMVSNTLNTFCSVTIQCARCHNHKFDPITQEHYYSLQAVFAAVDRAERPYDLDPHVEQDRRELAAYLGSAREELQLLQQAIREEGGRELEELEQQLAELKPQTQPAAKGPAFGYHSAIANSSDAEKWVQVDLGREVEIAKVVLRPCHDDYADIGAGFGFPLRFRVETASDAAAFAGGAGENKDLQTHVLQTRATDVDLPNPALAPYEIAAGVKARFVRVTATTLAERKDDYIFALAELQVLDGDGNNLAAGASVTSLDSIEAPVRWRAANLTDGLWAEPTDADATARYAQLQRQHADLLARLNTPERHQRRQELEQTIDHASQSLEQLPQGRMVYAAATHFAPQGSFKPTAGEPRQITLLHRGNVTQSGQPVRPGSVPLAENDSLLFDLDESHSEADRRAALAEWLTHPDHPLLWRSIVNRIWQYHFGQGLVGTPNDFGRMGQPPTHPELLDWLGVEFRDSGGSFKHLHRLIVCSAAYRQSSVHRVDDAAIDAGNQFLWRMNSRRLSAEEIRDAMLAVSGRLDRTAGGPGYYLFELEKPEHSPHYQYHKHDPNDPTSHRRSVYRFVVRSQPNPWMVTLDCADSSQSTPKREETLTSLQALSLLNNDFTLAMAEHFADRLLSESPEIGRQVDGAMTLTTGQAPDPQQRQKLIHYAAEHGLPNLCRILFNQSAFVFVD
jgi:mono/diheme cytochrome c family protein